MKITRLKSGYRIRLSDSEFDALHVLVGYGEGDVNAMEDHEWKGFTASEKRGLNKLLKAGAWYTEDRRK